MNKYILIKKDKNKGFSLLELTISMALLVLIFTTMMFIFSFGSKSSSKQEATLAYEQTVKSIIHYLKIDIRKSSSIQTNTQKIIFSIIKLSDESQEETIEIKYSWTDSIITREKIGKNKKVFLFFPPESTNKISINFNKVSTGNYIFELFVLNSNHEVLYTTKERVFTTS